MASRRLINTMACIRPFSCHLDRLVPSSSALPKVLSNDFVVPFLLKGRPIWSAPFQCMKFSSNEQDDTHDDFKPVNKSVSGTSSIQEFIEKDIKEHNIMVYMKGIPEAPQCGFSKMVVEVLQHHAVPFAARNVLADQDLRDGIKKFSHWPTIPQVFIKGEFVGGSDILLNMHRTALIGAYAQHGYHKKALQAFSRIRPYPIVNAEDKRNAQNSKHAIFDVPKDTSAAIVMTKSELQ